MSGPSFVRLLACAVGGFVAAVAAENESWTPFFLVDGFAHAEPVPIRDYYKGWDAPLSSGSDAVTHNWLEAGVRHGRYTVSYVNRYDYEIKASRDFVELYHRTQNKQELDPGVEYDLRLRAFHQHSHGLRLAYRRALQAQLELEAGISVLSGRSVTDGSLAGSATVVAARDYDYRAQVSYFYKEDYLLDRPDTVRPRGEGGSLDLAVQWRPLPPLLLRATLRDAYGFIDWDVASFTQAQATSDVKEYDSSGYVRFNPTLSGREGERRLFQRLHPWGLFEAQARVLDRTRVGARWRYTEVNRYLSATAARELAPGLWLGLELMPIHQAWGGRLSWAGLDFSLLADRPDPDDAHLLQLGLGFVWQF